MTSRTCQIWMVLHLLTVGCVGACKESKFASNTTSRGKRGACPAGQKCNDLPGKVPTPAATTPASSPASTPEPIVPKACNAQTLVSVGTGGMCPENYAVYGIDDPTSRQAAGSLACCPLPAGDILTGDVTSRPSGTCSANEVLVGNEIGLNGIANAKCRAINTSLYRLSAAGVEVCYFGNGSAGQGNAPTCSSKGGIPAAFSAITSPGSSMMGNDGCLNFPWGSVSVAQQGRSCDTQQAMQLQKIDGTPVKMFE